jgi:glycosyl transferase family 1
VIVLLHSAVGNSLGPIRRLRSALTARRAPLVSFVANELSLPGQPIAAKIDLLRELGAQYVATQLLLDTGQYLYGDTGATVLSVPHALNPNAYRPEVPNNARAVDVGFRGARYLPSIGDDDRNRIIDYFATSTFDPPLAVDVRFDVSYGRRQWAHFLNECKATVAAEAGATEVRRDDAILEHSEHERGVGSRDLRLRASLRPIHRYVPRPAKNLARRVANRLAGRAEGPQPPSPVAAPPVTTGVGRSGKCVSSRHFDAIGTETALIMFPGRYNDLLVADEHYLCLESDFSNIDDVLARFRDDATRLSMVRTTREWALESHTHAHRVRALLDAIEML